MKWKWKNALTDGLPEDKEQVLISVDGINHIATYRRDGMFNVTFEGKVKSYTTVKNIVYWVKFIPPEL